MLGIFPTHGIFNSSLGQNFDLLGTPKTLESLGILTSGTKIGVQALKRSKTQKYGFKDNDFLEKKN